MDKAIGWIIEYADEHYLAFLLFFPLMVLLLPIRTALWIGYVVGYAFRPAVRRIELRANRY